MNNFAFLTLTHGASASLVLYSKFRHEIPHISLILALHMMSKCYVMFNTEQENNICTYYI